MQNIFKFLRLMRVDKPVGFFLLLWPTLWALWVASHGHVSLKLWIIFSLGVFVMRSAGCVINDMVDRRLDVHVARTASRPLAAGQISFYAALLLVIFLLALALGLVLSLNRLCFGLACGGLIVTVIYPFMKRWVAAPQCVLGIAFSLGIPMAFAAVDNSLVHLSWILWSIGILWPIIYDTLYAIADRPDDLKIGIHSTAILFGKKDKAIIALLEVCWFIAWLFFAYQQHLSRMFYMCWLIAVVFCFYEHKIIRYREPRFCFRAFLNHAWIGGILFLGLSVSTLFGK